MVQLKVSEHYVSVQGEGDRVGLLTQFLRFAGCNMRCPGWPCDTPHAIFPDQIRASARNKTIDDLVLDIQAMPGRNLCWTGGEPFLQNNDLLHDLFRFTGQDYSTEVFTNGSFIFPDWALENLHFMMDWKLGGSGEAETQRENRIINAKYLSPSDSIKFVIASSEDLQEAERVYHQLMDLGTVAQFWIGVAWERVEIDFVVEWLIVHDLPWRLNVQTHKYIWDPNQRGV